MRLSFSCAGVCVSAGLCSHLQLCIRAAPQTLGSRLGDEGPSSCSSGRFACLDGGTQSAEALLPLVWKAGGRQAHLCAARTELMLSSCSRSTACIASCPTALPACWSAGSTSCVLGCSVLGGPACTGAVSTCCMAAGLPDERLHTWRLPRCRGRRFTAHPRWEHSVKASASTGHLRALLH